MTCCISARAPVLVQAIDDAGNKLAINDCSAEGFNEFLRYLYCEKINDKRDEIIFEVLSLAHTYDVEHGKQFCQMILKNNLNASNANGIFQIAHKYELSKELKEASFALIQT